MGKQDVLSWKASHMIKEFYLYVSLPTWLPWLMQYFGINNLCLAYNGLRSIWGTHPSTADYTGLIASHNDCNHQVFCNKCHEHFVKTFWLHISLTTPTLYNHCHKIEKSLFIISYDLPPNWQNFQTESAVSTNFNHPTNNVIC